MFYHLQVLGNTGNHVDLPEAMVYQSLSLVVSLLMFMTMDGWGVMDKPMWLSTYDERGLVASLAILAFSSWRSQVFHPQKRGPPFQWSGYRWTKDINGSRVRWKLHNSTWLTSRMMIHKLHPRAGINQCPKSLVVQQCDAFSRKGLTNGSRSHSKRLLSVVVIPIIPSNQETTMNWIYE